MIIWVTHSVINEGMYRVTNLQQCVWWLTLTSQSRVFIRWLCWWLWVWEEAADEGGGSASTIPHRVPKKAPILIGGSRSWQNATFASPSASISTIRWNMKESPIGQCVQCKCKSEILDIFLTVKRNNKILKTPDQYYCVIQPTLQNLNVSSCIMVLTISEGL